MDDYIYRPLRLARVRVFKMQSLGYRRGAARDFAELERGARERLHDTDPRLLQDLPGQPEP